MKLKRGSGSKQRHAKGGQQKRGAGWHTGQIAKKKAGIAVTRSATAPPAAAEPAAPAEPAPSSSRKRKRTGTAKRVAKSRAAAPKAPDRRRLAAAAAKLPKGLGTTASGRHSAFAREGRSDASAERLAQYHGTKTGTHVKKLIRKGNLAEAAAAHAAYNRDPDVRLLNPAAGVQLSEDASLDTQLVDNIVPLLSAASRSHSVEQNQFAKALATSLTSTASPKKHGKAKRQRPESGESGESGALLQRKVAARFEIKQQTASKLFAQARANRRKLEAHEVEAYLIDSKRRLGPKKATPEWIERVWVWLTACKLVRISPTSKDTLLVRGNDGKKNVRVPRWYTDNTSETAEIVVPVELVLHTSFEMEQAALPPRGASAQQRQGVSKGAVVLAETDHEAAMEELRKRYGGD